jgi:hypothetical protein
MTEDEAWDELERKQNKKPKQFTQRMALQIAYNALSAIDRETPYPIAKHALMCINGVLNAPQEDWEAIAADQALTIALLQSEKWDTSDMAHRPNGLTVEQLKDNT